jgi:hypothetical protein
MTVSDQPNPRCPLCGLAPQYRARDPERDRVNVECERCGGFAVTAQALTVITPEQKPLLSAYCRRSTSSDLIVIRTDNIADLITSLPKYTPREKLLNLLVLMGRMTPSLFESTGFDRDRDYPLLVAKNPSEIAALETELERRGFVDGTRDSSTVTLEGWEAIEQIEQAGNNSIRVFVAMWFDPSRDDVYNSAIEPAIRKAGYDPLRIDRHEHVNRIDDEIIGQIRRSRFMVADLTGQRHGVYFEAGLMSGLGRNVIWMCAKDELEAGKLHFDVRQFNFIAYETAEDAGTRLYNRILAIEGEGPGESTKPGS